MRLTLMVIALGWMACASRAPIKQDTCKVVEPPEGHGGACQWWVTESSAECVVETDFEGHHRVPGTIDEFEGFRGYDKKKLKCGESRKFCGAEFECTCNSLLATDGGHQ